MVSKTELNDFKNRVSDLKEYYEAEHHTLYGDMTLYIQEGLKNSSDKECMWDIVAELYNKSPEEIDLRFERPLEQQQLSALNFLLDNNVSLKECAERIPGGIDKILEVGNICLYESFSKMGIDSTGEAEEVYNESLTKIISNFLDSKQTDEKIRSKFLKNAAGFAIESEDSSDHDGTYILRDIIEQTADKYSQFTHELLNSMKETACEYKGREGDNYDLYTLSFVLAKFVLDKKEYAEDVFNIISEGSEDNLDDHSRWMAETIGTFSRPLAEKAVVRLARENKDIVDDNEHREALGMDAVSRPIDSILSAYADDKKFQQKLEKLYLQEKLKKEIRQDDYLQSKLNIVRKGLKKQGFAENDMGKTGDSCCGKISDKHTKIAKAQTSLVKEIMLSKRNGRRG